MAQLQEDAITISIPVADSQTLLPSGSLAPLATHDANLNAALTFYRIRGYDLVTAIYVPPGPIPPHFQLFFVRNK